MSDLRGVEMGGPQQAGSSGLRVPLPPTRLNERDTTVEQLQNLAHMTVPPQGRHFPGPRCPKQSLSPMWFLRYPGVRG